MDDLTASDEAKKALEGVTPGPWLICEDEEGEPATCIMGDGFDVATCWGGYNAAEADAKFIAWAREGVPALLAEIAAKDAEIARLTHQPSPDVAALVEALEMARDLLEPFADPDLSLGLGGNVIPKIDAALARVSAKGVGDE